jgi:acetyltransferase
MQYSIHRYPADLIDVMRLPDGRRITIRPVLPQDDAILQAFVRELSPRSRRRRFFTGVQELSPDMLQRLMHVDYVTQLALLGEVFDGDREIMVGEARYAIGEDGRTAEFAVATADAWQGLGIAKAMLAKIEGSAVACGIRQLVGAALPDNTPLLEFARGAGFTIRRNTDDACLLRLEKGLPPRVRG